MNEIIGCSSQIVEN